MTKPIAFGLLAVGLVLLGFGVAESGSFSSEVSKTFTGSPTDHAIWLMAAGALSSMSGLIGISRQ
jgi:hypothetical protein